MRNNGAMGTNEKRRYYSSIPSCLTVCARSLTSHSLTHSLIHSLTRLLAVVCTYLRVFGVVHTCVCTLQYVTQLRDNNLPIPVVNKTKDQVEAARRARKLQRIQKQVALRRGKWDPSAPVTGQSLDAYKTLFVGRLAYDVTSDELKHEFSYYGPISSVSLIKNDKDRSCGYAFIEFESSKDMTTAYKDADGRKIHGRRILVDVERGRTVKNWLPRRLGGGTPFIHPFIHSFIHSFHSFIHSFVHQHQHTIQPINQSTCMTHTLRT